ncbi:MAG: hypothetical protein MUC96_07530 [Myxococcaceae bacterium]|jgi:hypothetical protein|nr:hypothetical protein [Myxococcaceae bacterium]
MRTSSRRSGWWWLAGAVLLLLLAGWVMLGAEPPPRPPPPRIDLPTRMTSAELGRVEARRTYLPVAPDDAGFVEARPPPKAIDPVLSLIPEHLERGAVVAEVNAIFNSELGPLLFECLTAGNGRLSSLADAGFDPMVHVDRVAVIDDTIVMSGNLKTLPPPAGSVVVDYGPRARLIEPPAGTRLGVMGVWNDQLLVVGDSAAETKALLDRLERREPVSKPAFDDSIAYGEVYGVLKPELLGSMFDEVDPKLRDLMLETTTGLTLHADVGHDLGLVGDVSAKDATKADELRRALGSFISLARIQAQQRGKTDEANLLDLARVRSGDGAGGFRLEAGVPNEVMKSMLASCVTRGKERAARRADAGAE